MCDMKKSKYEMIIDGLSGKPITELVDNWIFTIKEVAPHVYKVEGRNKNERTAFGGAGTAEEALDYCLKKVDRIILWENRLERIKEKIRKHFLKQAS